MIGDVTLARLLPWPWRVGILLALVAVVTGAAYFKGRSHEAQAQQIREAQAFARQVERLEALNRRAASIGRWLVEERHAREADLRAYEVQIRANRTPLVRCPPPPLPGDPPPASGAGTSGTLEPRFRELLNDAWRVGTPRAGGAGGNVGGSGGP